MMPINNHYGQLSFNKLAFKLDTDHTYKAGYIEGSGVTGQSWIYGVGFNRILSHVFTGTVHEVILTILQIIIDTTHSSGTHPLIHRSIKIHAPVNNNTIS